jgi:hypothetical protein
MDASLKSSQPSAASPPSDAENRQTGADAVAVVQISSEPNGADITVDGDYAENTPSQIKLKPGVHSIKIAKKDFAPWERSIKVEAGESRNVAAELEKSK